MLRGQENLSNFIETAFCSKKIEMDDHLNPENSRDFWKSLPVKLFCQCQLKVMHYGGSYLMSISFQVFLFTPIGARPQQTIQCSGSFDQLIKILTTSSWTNVELLLLKNRQLNINFKCSKGEKIETQNSVDIVISSETFSQNLYTFKFGYHNCCCLQIKNILTLIEYCKKISLICSGMLKLYIFSSTNSLVHEICIIQLLWFMVLF